MEVAFCALADHANETREGKLNVIGVFDRISAKDFPAQHHAMAIVLRFRTRYQDSEESHRIRVTMEGPDGDKLVNINGEISVGTMQPGQIGHQNAIFNIANAKFERSGTYVVRVFIDGEQETEAPLTVRQIG